MRKIPFGRFLCWKEGAADGCGPVARHRPERTLDLAGSGPATVSPWNPKIELSCRPVNESTVCAALQRHSSRESGRHAPPLPMARRNSQRAGTRFAVHFAPRASCPKKTPREVADFNEPRRPVRPYPDDAAVCQPRVYWSVRLVTTQPIPKPILNVSHLFAPFCLPMKDANSITAPAFPPKAVATPLHGRSLHSVAAHHGTD